MGSKMSARCASEPSAGGLAPLPDITAPAPPSPPAPAEKDDGLKNPGDYEDLCKKVKDQLLPTALDGAKVIIQKGLSNNFQTSHTIALGSSTQPSSWGYGATYIGTTKIDENDFRPVMMGEVSTTGNFSALFLHQSGPWKMKLNGQTQKDQWVGYQGTGDYSGSDYTASCTIANPNLLDGSVVLVGQYLQALTSKLSLGSELFYQRASDMQGTMLSVGGRYIGSNWEAAARVGLHAWHVNYQHKLDDSLVALADMEGSLMQGETNANLGFKYDATGGLTVRGRVSSQGTVTGTAEKTLDPFPGTLTLSAQVNHWTDESKVGVMVILG